MICISLINKDLEQICSILDRPEVQMAEVRLDACPLGMEEVEDLFSSVDKPLVATYRITEPSQAADAEAKLLTAIRAGAAYIDLDIDAPAMMCKRLRREAREAGTLLIRSFHDFEGTDSTRALSAVVEKCLHLGADVVKIATTAVSPADCAKTAKLYEMFPPENLIAFCMGPEGRSSRVDCLRLGAPFSYALLDEASAPGQMTLQEMSAAVYGDFRCLCGGPVQVGSSKSLAQRAIVLASIAGGESRLSGYTTCGDNESAIAVARALGADVALNGSTLVIKGIGANGAGSAGGRRLALPGGELHTGESGFLTRMCIPLLAALGATPAKITGEKTLLTRPLPGAKAMMAAFGVQLSGENVPLTVSGRLGVMPDQAAAGRQTVQIDGSGGSQLVSGLLAALPLCREGCTVRLVNPKSIPYIFMTLDVMRQFGVDVGCEMEGGEEFAESQDWSLCEAMTFTIPGGCTYKAAEITLEADWSAAANFMTAGAIFGGASIKGLDTKSLQADLSILDILPLAGACVSQEEESGIVHVLRGPLRAFEIDASNCPDLVPILSFLAAFCQGQSTISGVARLASKESNRPGVIVEMLGQMGVRARLRGDKLQIEGHSLESRILSGHLLRGGVYATHGDHRIAMALKVAAIGASPEIVLDDDAACVSKSFPAFNLTFREFSGRIINCRYK